MANIHLTLHGSRRRYQLLVRELLEDVLLVFHHVTVIRQIGIVGATFVLQGLDWSREIDFAFEELLARNFVELVCGLMWIFRSYGNVLVKVAYLHAHFVASV